ncbi:sterol O-acyltransferase 1 isoform X2 [Diachasma alloeum]|uniref:sterol O-acyltransferase 1 isoform X2 n=1 Tax=Diachasma alloeum TaxID=454923 RepID=UPI0007381CD1|nr:sterol O-acyltransferase 1 isoform X2 [Diachasma alloeum]
MKTNGSEGHHWPLTKQMAGRISIEDVRERMQKLQQDVLDQVGDRLNDMVTEVIEGIENIAHSGTVPSSALEKLELGGGGKLPEKDFRIRNSVLTDVFNDVKHVRPIYNVWLMILLSLLLHTISNDLIEKGKVNLGFVTIAAGLAKFPDVIRLWSLMFTSSLSVYAFHSFWARQRLKFQPKSPLVRVWDYTWLLIFLIYQLAFLYLPARAVLAAELPPPSTLIVVMEQVRMIMKIHAFVRSTSPTVISYKPHTEGRELDFPGFSKFLYFMFAPTLIYRDSYPRTRTISWRFVVWHFLEVGFVIFFVAFLCERFIFPTYKNFGVEPVTLSNVLPKICSSVLPGLGLYLSGFYCLLHAWMNAWAELLKFGDRMYYKDWWNSVSYGSFYRNWNVVIHDWLYTYIYKDFYEIVFPRKKAIAMSSVFFISAVFHEYILSIAFHMFYPMLFVIFLATGYPLVWLTQKRSHSFGNVFLWFSLLFGNGLLLSTYSMEYFARVNCPGFGDDFLDIILPRSWMCNSTKLESR